MGVKSRGGGVHAPFNWLEYFFDMSPVPGNEKGILQRGSFLPFGLERLPEKVLLG